MSRELSLEEKELDIIDAFNILAIELGSNNISRISQNIGKLEFLINSDILIKKTNHYDEKPVFCYVEMPKGLENNNIINAKEIIEGLKNNETVVELQLQHNGQKVSPLDLNVQLDFFLIKNKIKINEVSPDDFIDSNYINQFNSFNMNCYKSILGMLREIRRELESVEPVGNKLLDNFDRERDQLVDLFIKEQSGFVMEHFLNYEAMLARKKDKVIDLLRSHSRYSKMLSDIYNRREQSVKNLVSFRVKELIKNFSSYDRYLYVFPLGRIVTLKYIVMFSLDEIMEENGVRIL